MAKTAKDALKLSIGIKLLEHDELQIVMEVEAMVNTRLHSYVDDQPDNLITLSPAHFLGGNNECEFSVNDNLNIKSSRIL